MKLVPRILFTLLIICFISSCSTSKKIVDSNQVIRMAANAPTSFAPAEGVTLDSDSCKSPMIDTTDGTQIYMVSASGGFGNYRAPEGKYGLEKGELLRLNCKSGEVLGIVKEKR